MVDNVSGLRPDMVAIPINGGKITFSVFSHGGLDDPGGFTAWLLLRHRSLIVLEWIL